MTYILTALGAWAVTRAGRKLVSYMPLGSKRRRLMAVVFGGGGPGTPT